MVKTDAIPIQALRSKVKDFLTPRPDKARDNAFAETKPIELEGLGAYHKSKGVISLTNDRGTSYRMYIAVQNEVTAAILELRNDFAKQHYGLSYQEMIDSKDARLKIIRKAIPINVSEAEPVNFGS